MHDNEQQIEAGRPLTHYALLGAMSALALEAARFAAGRLLVTHQQYALVDVAIWLALACECAVSYGIGRRAGIRWYCGLSTIIGQLGAFCFSILTARHAQPPHLFFLPTLIVPTLAKAGALAVFAYLGGTVSVGRKTPTAQRPGRFAYASILGAVVASALEGAELGIKAGATHAYDAAAQAAAKFGSVNFGERKDALFIDLILLSVLVYLLQCGASFWVGYRTAPRWYWGLSPLLPKLARFALVSLPAALSVPAKGGSSWLSGFMGHVAISMLFIPEGMAFAAIMGSRIGRRRLVAEQSAAMTGTGTISE